MKKKFIYLLSAAFFIMLTSFMTNQKQGRKKSITFSEYSYESALKEAKNLNKLIFVDAYADWCKPCKWMEKKTFTNPLVADLFNENFINIKIDVDTPQGEQLARKHMITSLPTLLFLNGSGEVVQKSVGALNPDDLMIFAESVLK